MKVLLSGFDPFGGESINPAYEAVKLLPTRIAGAQVVGVEIPTVFGRSFTVLRAAIERESPDVVLCVGQAGGRVGLTAERVAINVDDARIKDNDGNQPIDEPIVAHGEPAYFTSLPVKAMVKAVREIGLPSSVSNTAGTFVCNHIMYQLLHYIRSTPALTGVRGGFVHVPFLHEQVITKANTPSMSSADIARSLEAAIEAIVTNEHDIKVEGGATH